MSALASLDEHRESSPAAQELTDAERRLWSKLRRRQLGGFRFRRQAPPGPYFVDFLCLEERLIIEVDGGQHAVEQAADAKCTTWLEGKDFRVLRFWNNQVLANTDVVIETILRALRG